ncbi:MULTISPECIES: hypothetical protein [Actinosynnema]|uniref:hypothetical protein n=1 Tax=Actinosynnema TaxID=40566 RepID=UPI0020A3FF4A|nr:hypothetical protein [Actinosynnema pretiosum]
MESRSISTAGSASIVIAPDMFTLTWHQADHGPLTVPWFASTGVLDYASASHQVAVSRPQAADAGAGPAYGDPLVVRPDLGGIYYRVGGVLHSAPIRGDRVDFTAAAAVDWAAADADYDRVRVVEHNLAQCSTLPTLDPPLHVVQVERSGRLSLSFLLADLDGSPLIGPTTHHYQPHLAPGRLKATTVQGLPALAALWEGALRRPTTGGGWRFLPPRQALETLTELGFTVTGAASRHPGLAAALNTGTDSQWVPGWYGGTRLLALARFERSHYGGDLHYEYHKPGSLRGAVSPSFDGVYGSLLGVQVRADVETRPPGERVYVESGYVGGGMARPVEAGQVALHEPVLIEGTLPIIDHEVSWSAACRRCSAPMSCGPVGRHDFVPYVHELAAESSGLGPVGMWCPAHPVGDRTRPHAPVCRVDEGPDRDTLTLPAASPARSS